MAPKTHPLRLPFALGIGLVALTSTASADEHPGVAAYHREYRTAIRPDPPAVVRDSSWSGQAGPWWNDQSGPPAQSAWWAQHRPDPNRRRIEIPSDGSDGAWWRDDLGWHETDERARHGWRAGWRGAAPGPGGVWWFGWGGDWPSYAGSWERGGWQHHHHGGRWSSWGGGRSDHWHGEFGFGQGWGGGRRVIALPAQGGE
jgi:hypothetical protein